MKEYKLTAERQEYVIKNLKREMHLRKYFPLLYRGFKERWVEIKKFDLSIDNIPNNFDGYKIVHISDIHFGTWMTSKRLSGIVHMINHQNADIICYTGDLFSYGIDLWEKNLVEILSELKSKDGVVSVMGNHDYWNGHQKVRRISKEIGMVELSNNVLSISRGKEELFFSGTDSIYEDRYDLEPVLEKIPENSFSILLSHEPDTADISAKTGRFALQLSGHAHGGQMILPFIGPAVRVRHAHNYPLGLYKINQMYLYTNRGLGTSIAPIRINCKPEITVITLKKSE